MEQEKIRNVAIIAHVDHGKTTLVDQLFRQSGMFRDNQEVKERLMDSNDQERERGITIKSKNGACTYKEYLINIIDTPGHADFGGEVERVLKMADGALFLVDAQEGPMPQSHFVLKKAVALDLPVIVIVNKIDKPSARCDWVVDQVFDLLVKLEAPDHLLDFTVVYASSKEGVATFDLATPKENINDVFDAIIDKLPQPKGCVDDPFQVLISAIDHSPFLGRLAIGKITSGKVTVNDEVILTEEDTILAKSRITKIYGFKADQFVEISEAASGQIVALSGFSDVRVSQTISNPDHPLSIKGVPIDPPTISMTFMANTSPFAGKEGEFVTSSQLKDRLFKELLTDVALKVEDLGEESGYKVSGRGELHLSIFIEKLMREGYEFQVSRPMVILKEENGQKKEPFEELTVEVPEECMGAVIERLGERKGVCLDMVQEHGLCRMIYKIPTRGLLGYQTEFMTATKGMGQLYYRFLEYAPFLGDLRTRKNGVMISNQTAPTVAYALFNLQERGRLFLGAGVDIYEGQIIGEYSRSDDLVVNPNKGKKLSNVRSSGSDDAVVLTPHVQLSLEQSLAFIDDTELVECTPKAVRLRKRVLIESNRKRTSR